VGHLHLRGLSHSPTPPPNVPTRPANGGFRWPEILTKQNPLQSESPGKTKERLLRKGGPFAPGSKSNGAQSPLPSINLPTVCTMFNQLIEYSHWAAMTTYFLPTNFLLTYFGTQPCDRKIFLSFPHMYLCMYENNIHAWWC
jgi:hypothetical protein